jgi:hypothetical protein
VGGHCLVPVIDSSQTAGLWLHPHTPAPPVLGYSWSAETLQRENRPGRDPRGTGPWFSDDDHTLCILGEGIFKGVEVSLRIKGLKIRKWRPIIYRKTKYRSFRSNWTRPHGDVQGRGGEAPYILNLGSRSWELSSRFGRFTHRETTPGSHWLEGWVDPRAALDVMVKRITASVGNQTPTHYENDSV